MHLVFVVCKRIKTSGEQVQILKNKSSEDFSLSCVKKEGLEKTIPKTPESRRRARSTVPLWTWFSMMLEATMGSARPGALH